MTQPVETLPGDAGMGTARALLRLRGFRHVPVVGPEGRPHGILSDRDVFGEHADPHGLVSDAMSREVLTATRETWIRDLARMMVHAKVGAIPILNEHRVVVGIVTTTDVLAVVVNEAPLDLWA